MEEIQLWTIERENGTTATAQSVTPLSQLDAERLLEEVLTSKPELLSPNLLIVGRQTPTDNGALDLLGVDDNGHLVVFELKRGMMVREAVAQVVDYSSYLNSLDIESLSKHIAERSGANGVNQIDDFQEWYREQYRDTDIAALKPPRMMLVGLGADDRTQRMVQFLADSGVDISLITFQAFQRENKIFLGKVVAVETQVIRSPSGTSTAQANEQSVRELAARLGLTERLVEVRNFMLTHLPKNVTESPGKGTIAYYLEDYTEAGTTSWRAYISVYLDKRSGGEAVIHFWPRAIEAMGEGYLQLVEIGEPTQLSWGDQFPFASQQAWKNLSEVLPGCLKAMRTGWERRLAKFKAEINQELPE